MTNAGSKSMARVLEDHRTAVLERWIAGVTASTRGRLTEREVERDLRPLYDAIARLVDEEGSDDGRAAGEDEAKSILAEISRDRARQGFTPSETAVSVFSLKDAVLAEVGGADGAGIAFLDFSRAIDGLA